MNKEQIMTIIEEEVGQLGWTMELALPYMATLGFSPEIVAGNELFGGPKLRMTVEMAYYAFEDEAKKMSSEPKAEVYEGKYNEMYGLFGIGTEEFMKTHGVFLQKMRRIPTFEKNLARIIWAKCTSIRLKFIKIERGLCDEHGNKTEKYGD